MHVPQLLAGAGLTLLLVCGVFLASSGWYAAPKPAEPQPATAPGDTLLVTNPGIAYVTLIDVRTGKTRLRVPTNLCTENPCPHEVAVSPTGRTAAVSNYRMPDGARLGNALIFMDVATGEATLTLDLGRFTALNGLQWLDDHRLLCTCETAQALLEIDTKPGRAVRVLRTGQQGSYMLAVSADRQRAYVANRGSATVTVFDLVSRAKIRDVAVGQAPEGIALSPDGRWLWVGNRDDQTVSVIDTQELRVVDTLPAPGTPCRIAFAPNGKTVVVTEPAGGELAVYDAVSAREVKRIPLDRGKVSFDTPGPKPGPRAVAFSPDGKVAYCTVRESNAVAVVDVDRGEVIDKFDAGPHPDGIAFGRRTAD